MTSSAMATSAVGPASAATRAHQPPHGGLRLSPAAAASPPSILAAAADEAALQSPVRLGGPGSAPARQGRHHQRYTQAGTRLVSGCVPFHRDAQTGHMQILLISNRNRTQWIIPKGGWDDDETEAEAALRESYEEAGVRGRIGPRLVTYTHTGKLGHKQHHAYYALEVDEVLTEWPDCDSRRRCWVAANQAAAMCTRKGMHDAILRLLQIYGSHSAPAAPAAATVLVAPLSAQTPAEALAVRLETAALGGQVDGDRTVLADALPTQGVMRVASFDPMLFSPTVLSDESPLEGSPVHGVADSVLASTAVSSSRSSGGGVPRLPSAEGWSTTDNDDDDDDDEKTHHSAQRRDRSSSVSPLQAAETAGGDSNWQGLPTMPLRRRPVAAAEDIVRPPGRRRSLVDVNGEEGGEKGGEGGADVGAVQEPAAAGAQSR